MKHYDVAIIGAGISGTALAYMLTTYTDIQKVVLVEKHDAPAQVSSHHTQNSQTLHYGDIETNYSLKKAKQVSKGARLVEQYLERFAKHAGVHRKEHKMVIGVGKKECDALRKRYAEFKKLFPKLKLIERKEIAKKEPWVVKGRSEGKELVAFYSPNGYILDYEGLAKHFLQAAQKNGKKRLTTHFGEKVQEITQEKQFTVITDNHIFTADTLIVNAGAMSLYFAKMLGYAKHLSVFSVAGNFYRAQKKLLNGKVYTMQLEKLPFAAPHGDPDVHDKETTRFGPSAKPLLMLERWNYTTVIYYLKSFSWTWDGIMTALKTMTDKTYFLYMTKNILYDIPVIGPRLFAKNVYKIIPTLNAKDIKKDKGYGGARPQIFNTKKREVHMGEARVTGKKCVFNITPSPGASTCLANAKRDSQLLINDFLPGYTFDEKLFEKNLL